MTQPPQPMAGASESPWIMTSSTMLKLVTQVDTCCTLSDRLSRVISQGLFHKGCFLFTKNAMLLGSDPVNSTCVQPLFEGQRANWFYALVISAQCNGLMHKVHTTRV